MLGSPTASLTTLPTRVQRYVLLVGIVGSVLTARAIAIASLGAAWPPGMLSLAITLSLCVGAIVLPIRLYHRGGVLGFNLTVGFSLALLWITDDEVALLGAVIASLVGFTILRAEPIKIAFNVAQLTIWFSAATLVVRVGGSGETSGDIVSLGGAFGLVTAAALAELINLGLLTELFHRIRGEPRTQVLRATFGSVTVVSLGANTLIALLVVVLADRSPAALLIAAPLFVSLLLSSRDRISVVESERQASLLHDMSRSLLESAMDDDAFDDAVGALRTLFQAEKAVLDVGPRSPRGELGPIIDAVVRSGRPSASSEGEGVLATPVVLDGRIVGALAVAGRRGFDAWDDADLALLGTVAGEVAATLRARQLYDDVETERAALEVETQRLGDILHGASDGIVLLDDIGRIEACNPAMAALVGLLPEDAIGRRWDDVLRLEEGDGAPVHAASGSAFTRALAGDGRAVDEVRLRNADGGWRWLRCSVAPVVRAGDLAGVVLVAVDQTRQREVEELRGDFLATVSHELRTPLTPLRGFLTVLDRHGAQLTEERLATIHGSMEKQLGRLEDLIGDLLLVAEIDSGAPRVVPERVQLADVVAAVVAGEATATGEGDRIRVDACPTTVEVDPAALRRILRSLVSNGLKHTDGEVRVVVRPERAEVVVVVEDDGPGIPAGVRESVFEPFRRLGNHLHRTQGPGLGLAIARSLAEASGGRLVLGRSPSGGCAFELHLPAGREQGRDLAPGATSRWSADDGR